MKLIFLLPVLLLAAAPTEVVVGKGESLAQVAKRALGDERGASELKVLNGLKDEKLAPGTTLKLPGPDRAQALTALATARSAINHADARHARRPEAQAKLQEAEGHFQSARYKEAAQAADGVWKVLWANASGAASFQVEVADNGTTTVRSRSGPPVRVEAEGVTRPVYVGESVQVEKGAAPPPPLPARPQLAAPELLQPEESGRVTLSTGRKGPVSLSWKAVDGAERYEVAVVPAQGRTRTLIVPSTNARLTLPAGTYRWSVRALTQDVRSEPSAERRFVLVEQDIRIEVRNPTWK